MPRPGLQIIVHVISITCRSPAFGEWRIVADNRRRDWLWILHRLKPVASGYGWKPD